MEYVKRELARGIDDWEQRLGTALVKSAPGVMVKATPQRPEEQSPAPATASDSTSRPRG
jgi:hypothetical protein